MASSPSRRWFFIAGIVVLALVAGAAGALPATTQSAQPVETMTIQSAVDATIGYQGLLTDPDGARLNGGYSMRFELYRTQSGGAPVFEIAEQPVQISDGLFDVGLDVPQAVFDGGPLWLAIIINEETLSPRQQILPAPYAMSLRPGATIHQAATGAAVQAESAEGIGLHGAGQVYGLYGSNTGQAQGYGYGGYFESTTGIGVYGESTAQLSTQNNFAPGVHGHSERGVGIYGTSDAVPGVGVFGQSATGTAVYGSSGGNGVVGAGEVYGVYGASTATASGRGYGGFFESDTGIGVYGSSTAVPSTTNALPAGVYGYSDNGSAIYGEAGSNFAWGGYFDGHVRIDGSLVVSDSIFANDKSGYVFDVALNDDSEALSRGDVVVVTGVVPETLIGEIPVFKVQRARSAEDTAVIGIVDRRYIRDTSARDSVEEGPVAPGDYVSVVTLGAFQAIKVDASYGAIAPGDLLVTSPTPGRAMRADNPATGTVIGKSLGALDTGTGSVPVMVTMQ